MDNSPPPTDPVLVGSLEAAEVLGLHRNSLNRLAAAGVIKTAIKLPGRTGSRLFDPLELERFKAENFHPGPVVSYDAVTS